MKVVPCRTCVVCDENGAELYEALFHGFFEKSDIFAPSPMVGGHPGGVQKFLLALVEDRCGTVLFVAPDRIVFTDDLAQLLIDYKNKRNEEE